MQTRLFLITEVLRPIFKIPIRGLERLPLNAYGTDLSKTTLTAEDTPVRDWYQKWQTQEKDYYLILGRFVPEKTTTKLQFVNL